jgi:hypothetical protein
MWGSVRWCGVACGGRWSTWPCPAPHQAQFASAGRCGSGACEDFNGFCGEPPGWASTGTCRHPTGQSPPIRELVAHVTCLFPRAPAQCHHPAFLPLHPNVPLRSTRTSQWLRIAFAVVTVNRHRVSERASSEQWGKWEFVPTSLHRFWASFGNLIAPRADSEKLGLMDGLLLTTLVVTCVLSTRY